MIFQLLVVVLLFWVCVIDIRSRIIPNKLVAILFVVWLVEIVFSGSACLAPERVGCSLLVGFALWAIAALGEKITGKISFGMGDVKLISTVCLYFSPNEILLFLLLFSVVLLFWGLAVRLRGRNTFPCAPVIALSFFVLQGSKIIF